MINQQGLLIYPGRRYQKGGIAYMITELLPEAKVKLINCGLRKKEETTVEDILDGWTTREIEFEVTGRTAKTPENGCLISTRNNISDISMLPEKKRKLIQRRMDGVIPLTKMHPDQRTDSFMEFYADKLFETWIQELPQEEKDTLKKKRLGKERLPEEYSVSRSSLRRWLKQFNDSGWNARSLVRQTEDRGGGGGCRLKDGWLEEIITKTINEEYLTLQRKTVSETHNTLKDNIAKFNGSQREMPQPHFIIRVPNIVTIYRRIDRLDPYEVMVARLGKEEAEKHFRVNGPGINGLWAMERLEIDHSTLNIILVDDKDRLPIDHPVLTNGICKRTKNIPGSYIGFEPAGYASVCDFLYNAIPPKFNTRELYGTQHEILAYGLPGTLVPDNAPEFVGESLSDASKQLGFAIDPTDKSEPNQKPSIERFYESEYQESTRNIPGTTFMNIFDRKGYDSKFYSIMSLSTFRKAYHIYIADKRQYSPHRGLHGRTPADAWEEEMSLGHWPALPPNLDELRVLLGRKFIRTLEHYGIDFETLRYQNTESPELRELRKTLLTLPVGERYVTIKVDPDNIGRIYVYDHIHTKEFFEMTAYEPEYAEGLSLWAHRTIVKYRNAVNKETGQRNELSLMMARERLRELISNEFETTSSVRNRRHSKRFIMDTGKKDTSLPVNPYEGVAQLPSAELPGDKNTRPQPDTLEKTENRLVPRPAKPDISASSADYGDLSIKIDLLKD